jgi:hypothetical protein
VAGPGDDQRNEDVNRSWFRLHNGDPFTVALVVGMPIYSRDLADLPSLSAPLAGGLRDGLALRPSRRRA